MARLSKTVLRERQIGEITLFGHELGRSRQLVYNDRDLLMIRRKAASAAVLDPGTPFS